MLDHFQLKLPGCTMASFWGATGVELEGLKASGR